MPCIRNKKAFFSIISLFVLGIVFSFSNVLAAPDSELTYHGKLTDTLGVSVSDGNYDFTISIYDAEIGGTAIWSEVKTLTITSGIFSTTLGDVTPLDLTFDDNYWLEVQVGSNPAMIPRRKFTPTGFSLNSYRLNGRTEDYYLNTSSTAQTKQGSLSVGDDFAVDVHDLFVDVSTNRVGIGTAAPSQDFHVEGNMRVTGSYYDANNESGTNGQVLTSTATGTDWVDTSSLGMVFENVAGVVRNTGADASDDFVFGSSQLADDGNSDHDARIFFDKSKGAFRAGIATGTQWDDVNVGNYSIALGDGSIASGLNSVSIGRSTTASNTYAMAFGHNTVASGNRSVTFGRSTTASGDYAMAFGSYTTASAGHEVVFGQYEETYTPNDTAGWDENDRLFVVANGLTPGTRSNALTILKNGNFGIGTSMPAEQLTVSGAINIGTTTNTNAGSIRWTGTDFEGYDGLSWVPLTPVFGTSIDLISEVTGVLPVANGGTGQATLNDLIALGTNTTGNYVTDVIGNSQIAVGGTAGEGWTPILSIASNSIGNAQLLYDTGQHLTTTSTPTFATVNTGSGAKSLGDAVIVDGDTDSIPTNDQVFDFVIAQGYMSASADDWVDVTGDTMSGALMINNDLAVDTNTLFVNSITDRVGVGTVTPSAMFNLYGVNNDLRFSYDALNYADLAVNDSGELIIDTSSATESAIVIGSGVAQDASVQFDGEKHDFFSGIDNATGTYAIGSGTDVSGTATIIGPGTVSNSAGGTTVTGSGTAFLSTFRVGSTITIGSDVVTVTAIASDTSMTTDAITSANSGATYTYSGGTKLAVESSGNVGIGVSDPLYALDVRTTGSNAIIARFNNTSTNTSCTLTATGGTINCSSDERLKKNITPLNEGIDTLMQLKPQEYNWKFEGDSVVKTMGFIAQDVQDIPSLNRLVITDEETGYLQLSTIGMIPMITQAVQEQNALITTNVNDLTKKAGISFVSEEISDVLDFVEQNESDIIVLQGNANDLASDISVIETRLDAVDAGLKILDLLGATELTALESLLEINPLKTEGIIITGEDEGATIGVDAIEKDENEVFVETIAVTDDSRIFITAKGNVITQPLVVKEIKKGEGFYVAVANSAGENIEFDWMIVEDQVEKDPEDENSEDIEEDIAAKNEEQEVVAEGVTEESEE